MKSHLKISLGTLLFILPTIFQTNLQAGEFQADDELAITKPVFDDLYAAGGEVTIQAPVHGDLIATGGQLTINAPVAQDVTITGGQLNIEGTIGDDIRAAGGKITISKTVAGDAIIAGGQITFAPTARVRGELFAVGGDIRIGGTVSKQMNIAGGSCRLNGRALADVQMFCEEIYIDGEIRGKARLYAETIHLGENASFYSDVEYWHEGEAIDFESAQKNGKVTMERPEGFGEDFEMEEDEFFSGFWFLSLLWGLALIVFFSLLFPAPLQKAASKLQEAWLTCLGLGVAYFVALPIVSVSLMISVIGIPPGLLLLSVYILSLLVVRILAAILIAYCLSASGEHEWSRSRIMLAASLIFLVLKLLVWVPYLGWALSIVLFICTLGALLQIFGKQEVLPARR